ncbi:MAG: tryptophan--tRNA ligase [Candidatus Saccharimonadales bacterium]
MSKTVILTGLRSNSDLQLGNYFGALLPLIDMSRKKSSDYQINLFVPDLHSFTTPVDHLNFQERTTNNIKQFIAAGLPLDIPNIYLYRQSYIPAHSELTWILDCFTGVGEMSRMTQFKDKSSGLNDERVSIGLFNYPVLMAADILLYGASYVPVGEDQTQHLEFARNLGDRMNNRFNGLFVLPKAVKEQHEFFGKDQGLRIRDLVDPTKKMSKSDESSKGVIFLSDKPDRAAEKIMNATTDSFGEIKFDMVQRPGIANLLQILALLGNKRPDEVASDWEGRTSYGELKIEVATAVSQFLKDFQAKLTNIDEQRLQNKLAESETAINEQANATLLRVQRAVGLRS